MPAAAQSIWIGGTDNNLGTAANWAAAVAPVSGPTAWLVYDNTALSFTPAIDIPFTAGRIDFVGGTPYSLSGAVTLNGAGPLIFATGATHTLALTVALGANATFNVASELLSTGGFSGVGGLTKTGAGRLVLAGPATHAGVTTVSGGTLVLGDGGLLPDGIGQIVNDGALEIDRVAGSGVTTGAISGTGSVTVQGGGLISFFDLTYTGPTTVNAGIVGARFTNSGRLTIAAGAQVDTYDSTFGSLQGGGLLTVNPGGVTVGGDGTSTAFSGTLAGAGDFTKTGAGRQVLSGPITNTGLTTVSGGTLVLGDGGVEPNSIGQIVNDGALEIDRVAGFGVQTGAISGTGSLTVLAAA